MEHVAMMDRLFESSPAIVVILLGAVYMLWQNIKAKDQILLQMQQDMLTTVRDNTEAVRTLIRAIEDKKA